MKNPRIKTVEEVYQLEIDGLSCEILKYIDIDYHDLVKVIIQQIVVEAKLHQLKLLSGL